jgi:pyridoxine/pyridoxamine 5'-phosphate oxidase
MNEWFTTLDGLWDENWRQLEAVAHDRRSAARHTVLSTTGLTGAPQSRITVLRDANRAAGTVAVHTDKTTTKVAEIRADPRAALHLWQVEEDLQIRLRGHIEIAEGEAVRDLWARVPDGSRTSYGVEPAPGTPIPASDAYTRIVNPDHFAVLTLVVENVDIVHLSADYHRRALFSRADGWAGQWLAP